MTPKNTVAKSLVWLLWGANLGIIVYYWAVSSGAGWLGGDVHPAIAFGRLFGLIATFCALTQFILMGREGWLEPLFGLDRLARIHRLNGYAAIILMLMHPPLLAIGYSALTGKSIPEQYIDFEFNYPFVMLASVALVLFLAVVGTSIYIVRKRLKFETWYYVHLMTYIAIALLPFHQLTNGGSFFANTQFGYYWIGLYIFVALNLLIWRFGMPLYKYLRHGFLVEKVVAEVPRATSVYISGKSLDKFKAKGGQFVLVRFFTKGLWWQEHPFSLSQLPDDKHLRLTIRQLGDFTNQIPALKSGTKVLVSGPYGAFTLDRATKDKVLYIAGGIGITPLRAMIEAEAVAGKPSDAILMYGNVAAGDIALKNELEDLSARLNMPIHNVLSNDENYAGEHGYVDQEKLGRLVPDIAERDIFLCGPPPMMKGVRQALATLGVPEKQVHFESFALRPGD